jgi:D-apionolactonase
MNPQVHLPDLDSMVDALEGERWTVLSAMGFLQGRELAISPLTILPRFNPDAIDEMAASELTPGALPYEVDPRQMSLFGACWTAGSLKSLAEEGVGTVTCYETTGRRGVMETEEGSKSPPGVFPSQPGMVFPLYYVLADTGEMSGGLVRRVTSSDPSAVNALAMAKEGRLRIILYNLTSSPRRLTVGGLGKEEAAAAEGRRLNERTAREAMLDWASFRERTHELHDEERSGKEGGLNLTLMPYEVVRLDLDEHGRS